MLYMDLMNCLLLIKVTEEFMTRRWIELSLNFIEKEGAIYTNMDRTLLKVIIISHTRYTFP